MEGSCNFQLLGAFPLCKNNVVSWFWFLIVQDMLGERTMYSIFDDITGWNSHKHKDQRNTLQVLQCSFPSSFLKIFEAQKEVMLLLDCLAASPNWGPWRGILLWNTKSMTKPNLLSTPKEGKSPIHWRLNQVKTFLLLPQIPPQIKAEALFEGD